MRSPPANAASAQSHFEAVGTQRSSAWQSFPPTEQKNYRAMVAAGSATECAGHALTPPVGAVTPPLPVVRPGRFVTDHIRPGHLRLLGHRVCDSEYPWGHSCGGLQLHLQLPLRLPWPLHPCSTDPHPSRLLHSLASPQPPSPMSGNKARSHTEVCARPKPSAGSALTYWVLGAPWDELCPAPAAPLPRNAGWGGLETPVGRAGPGREFHLASVLNFPQWVLGEVCLSSTSVTLGSG